MATAQAITVEFLNDELKRVGLVDYDDCTVEALDESETVYPFSIVRLSWGVGEVDYFRAGALAESLAAIGDVEIDDETNEIVGIDEICNSLPPEIDASLIEAINEVQEQEEALERAERALAEAKRRWHFAQPVSFATFRPVRYVRGGNTDWCYGENGEVVECWNRRVIKDEQRCYAVVPSADVERINAEIASLAN